MSNDPWRRWRRLAPVRAVLGPVRRRLLDFQDSRPTPSDAVLDSLDLGDRPVRPMSRREFSAMAAAEPYYKGRWRYTAVALAEAATLIARHDITTALEVGAPVKPILAGAHVMDRRHRAELDPSVDVTIHDATVIPWPFEDKQFGLFVALQVFEHLNDRQPEAFREVRRIARHAVISLPIDWEMDDPANVHHRIPEERVLSWFAPVVPTRTVEGNRGWRRRVVYVFEDLAP